MTMKLNKSVTENWLENIKILKQHTFILCVCFYFLIYFSFKFKEPTYSTSLVEYNTQQHTSK